MLQKMLWECHRGFKVYKESSNATSFDPISPSNIPQASYPSKQSNEMHGAVLDSPKWIFEIDNKYLVSYLYSTL